MGELPQAPGPDEREEQQQRTRRMIRWLLIAIVAVGVLAIGLCVAALSQAG